MAPLILFTPAAGPQIGGGHVMRGIALAEALRRRGAAGAFAVPAWGERLLHRFASPEFAIDPLARSGDPAAIAAAVGALRPDVLVLDDFWLSAAQIAKLAGSVRAMVVIDDLADRRYVCDLLVDPSFGRSARDYAGRTPPGCELLVGPRYALLRESFGRQAAEPPLPVPEQPRRLFVSFGLADPGGVTARAVRRLRQRLPDVALDVALAADAASLPQLRLLAAADPSLHLHPDALNVAALMRGADAAVGAGGASTWERCAIGLPTLAVVVADNQREMIARLAAAGAVLSVDAAQADFEPAFDAAVERLADAQTRAALRQASQGLCDGRGASRVADAILRLVGRG